MPQAPTTYAAHDQRSRNRYAIALNLEYKLLRRGHIPCKGLGRTLNISSGGALVELSDAINLPNLIELSIQWPFLLESAIPLKLIARGPVLRKDGRRIAVAFLRHEFRTSNIRSAARAIVTDISAGRKQPGPQLD